jgi:hypothetical protein
MPADGTHIISSRRKSLMKKRVQVFQVKKTIWIKENGMRQPCDVSINRADFKAIDLVIAHAGHPECCGMLKSEDGGYNYQGKIASCFLEYTIALKCFVNDKDVLLFGNWYHKDFSGELCIHASIQNLIINHGKKTPSGLTPAA